MVAIHLTNKEFNKLNKSRNNIGYQMEEEPKMKNKLTDLQNHLFAELERLGDEELEGDKLTTEIERAKAVAIISEQVIDNASLVLKTAEFLNEAGYGLNGNIEGNLMSIVGNTQKENKLLGYKNE